jgi:hypothetical protein
MMVTMSNKDVEQQAIFAGVAVTPLTMPCTFNQLVDWLDHSLAAQRPGCGGNLVSATATSLTVA